MSLASRCVVSSSLSTTDLHPILLLTIKHLEKQCGKSKCVLSSTSSCTLAAKVSSILVAVLRAKSPVRKPHNHHVTKANHMTKYNRSEWTFPFCESR